MRYANDEPVARSSISFFENGMRGHSAVRNITNLGDNQYLIERTKERPDIRVLIVDIYILGEADIYEISPRIRGIDCIVLVGFNNRYSSAAKNLAKQMNVGLYDNREFFGALNCVGDSFLNYKKEAKI